MKMNKKDIQALLRGCESFKNIILELLYPTTCILCGRLNGNGLCDQCATENPVLTSNRCLCCSKVINDLEIEYCQDCLDVKKHFIQGASLWHHSDKVMSSIYKFKYLNHRIYAKKYAELLVQYYGHKIVEWKPEQIVAIPVHPSRRRTRGYNQAFVLGVEIIKEIERVYDVKIGDISHSVRRQKKTTYQKMLDNKQRVSNLQGAFQIETGIQVANKIIVIDDIYTTGATINEMAKILKNQGAKEVYFLTISIGQGF